MPKDKKPAERYKRIHEIFEGRTSQRAVVRLDDLADELGISVRQLNKDMNWMRERGIVFEYVAGERGWRYPEHHAAAFIDDEILTKEDLLHIRMAVEMMNKINAPGTSTGNLSQIFQKIYRAARKWTHTKKLEKIIYFDPLPHYEGGKHLLFFIEAIEYKKKTAFSYQAFHAKAPRRVVFHPWFLRHYDRRWYAGGYAVEEDLVRVFPLERIVGQPSYEGYFYDKPPMYDAETYWKYLYGITVPPGAKPQHILLAFTPLQGQYFIKTPFFEPYKIIEQTENHTIIELFLMVNIDLIRKLASLGNEVYVIEPETLRSEMQAFFQAAQRPYQ